MKVIQWLFTAAVWPTPVMLGMFGLVIPMLLSSAPTYGTTELNLNCTADPNLRIKVGSTVLSVPRRYSPNIREFFGENLGHSSEICQLPDDPAIYARGITFNFDGDPRAAEAEDSLTLPIWHVQIEIVRPNLLTSPERAYEKEVKLMESYGMKFSELERQHGFLVFDGFLQYGPVYIALPDTVESLDSVPLVVECSGPEITVGRTYYGRSCKTPYYSLTESVTGRYKFEDGRYPPKTFRDLDASVRTFVRSLVRDGT